MQTYRILTKMKMLANKPSHVFPCKTDLILYMHMCAYLHVCSKSCTGIQSNFQHNLTTFNFKNTQYMYFDLLLSIVSERLGSLQQVGRVGEGGGQSCLHWTKACACRNTCACSIDIFCFCNIEFVVIPQSGSY